MSRRRAAGLLAALILLLACSPALNWREVALGHMTALLPCKPDQAQRSMRLGQQDVVLEMAGCEAAGALFAMSHVQAQDSAHAAAVLADWRVASLRNLGATTATELPAPPGRGNAPSLMLQAQGSGSAGPPMQARLAWWRVGNDLYHLAVYAPRLTPEMTETFFSEPQLR